MSTGLVILIPGTDMHFVPFNHLDNNQFAHELQLNIEHAKKGKDPVNRDIINNVIVQLLIFLSCERWKNSFQCLKFAGEIHKYMQVDNKCTTKEFANNLVRLQRAFKKNGNNHSDAGMDQIIARLLVMMQFEDEIVTPDFYALWIEDFEGNRDIYGPPESQ